MTCTLFPPAQVSWLQLIVIFFSFSPSPPPSRRIPVLDDCTSRLPVEKRRRIRGESLLHSTPLHSTLSPSSIFCCTFDFHAARLLFPSFSPFVALLPPVFVSRQLIPPLRCLPAECRHQGHGAAQMGGCRTITTAAARPHAQRCKQQPHENGAVQREDLLVSFGTAAKRSCWLHLRECTDSLAFMRCAYGYITISLLSGLWWQFLKVKKCMKRNPGVKYFLLSFVFFLKTQWLHYL